ncbi:MAG: hypothetical protein LBH32_09635 [Dysgonamonadaceae bacterium]|nr:hypothetical protein [Dysgonamonadaceae bacterium]
MKNNIKKTSIYIIILFTGLASCNKNRHFPDVVTLVAHTTLTDFNDSSFVPKRIMCIDAIGSDFYCSDYSNGYFVLDEKFNIKKRIGSKGQGPGEFLGAGPFYFQGTDSIFILNEGKRSFELFVEDKHIESFSYPQGISLSHCTRFFVKNQQIFHSVIGDSLPVIAFNGNSHENQYMCLYTKWDNPHLKQHSTRHLVKGKNNFFVIGSVLPVFQRYDFEGNLLEDYDMEKLPEISINMKKYNGQKQIPTTYFTMCKDAYYCKDKVFILVASNINEYFCNTVYVLNVADKISHIGTYILGKGNNVYESFCVKNDTLLAFNAIDASLDVFTISE